MLRASVLLDSRGDGDALGYHQRYWIDGYGDGAAAVLHPRGVACRYRDAVARRSCVHCAEPEGIVIHSREESNSTGGVGICGRTSQCGQLKEVAWWFEDSVAQVRQMRVLG
jgi:hypothetical protein